MEMDKKLVNLQEKIRNSDSEIKQNKHKNQSKLPSQNVDSDEVKKNSEITLDQLNAMQL